MKLPATRFQLLPFIPLPLAATTTLFLTLALASGEQFSGMEGVELTADRFEVAKGGDVFIAQGNVRGARDKTVIEADKVVAWPADAEIYAEGNVLLTEDGTVSRSDKLLYNWKEHRGIVFNAELHKVRPDRLVNWHMTAPSVERRGAHVYQVGKAAITSCEFAEPHQYFTASKVVFREQHSIVVYNAVYRVHDVPVFYLPYYYRDLQYPWPWFHVGFGRSSDFGPFVQTDLGFEVHPGVDLILDMDYYGERGPGGGVNLEYENERRIGYLQTYFIEDHGEDFNHTPLLQDDRYRVKFFHRELLTDTDVDALLLHRDERFIGRWTADVEYNQLSDKNFYENFFEGEAKSQKEPENRVFVQGLWDNTAVSVLGQTSVNEFMDLKQAELRGSSDYPGQTEYLPRTTFDLLSQPLLDNRLLLTLGGEYARVRRRFEDEANLTATDMLSDFRLVDRFDFESELSAPFAVNFLHIEPFAFNRETHYEELLNSTEADWRTVYGGGVRLSTEFWRTFDASNAAWGINGLHHAITPEITFRSTQDPDNDPEDLIFFDDVDTERAEDTVTFNLRNVVQTKRGEQTVNWLEFEVLSHFFPSSERDNDGESWSNIETDLRWFPHPKVRLYNDNEIGTDPVQFEVFNAGVAYSPTERLTTGLGQRYSRDDSSRTIFSADSKLTEKWRAFFQSDYEWNEEEFFDVRIVVRRTFHCWVADFGFDMDRGKDERMVFFFISPQGGSEVFRTSGVAPRGILGDSELTY
jgi:LPS-assembly protein